MRVHIKVWDAFKMQKVFFPITKSCITQKHTATSICTQKHMFTQAFDTYTCTNTKHSLNICKSIWAHKPNLHTHTYKYTQNVWDSTWKVFLLADAEEKQCYLLYILPNTVDVMNGCDHNICIRAYTLWQTRTHCWAGFRVRDHFLPWGLGDGLLLFWPITRKHWLTPPAHWSWVINYQAVPCLGQMNISTWLPWNNEPHPKSLNRPILSAL